MTSNSDGSTKGGGRLGGIFSNVRSTKKLVDRQAEKREWKDSLTLRCESCGAPQEATRDFVCQYCGGPLVREEG
jgi:rRNA maturation endonuclease Nob1